MDDRLRLPPDADDARRTAQIANPLSADQSRMRTMLLPGLLETGAEEPRGPRGTRAHLRSGASLQSDEPTLPDEQNATSASWCPAIGTSDSWLHSGVDSRLLPRQGTGRAGGRGLACYVDFDPVAGAFPSSGQGRSRPEPVTAAAVGWLGGPSAGAVRPYDLRAPAVAAELDVEGLVDASDPVAMFRDLFAYPAVEQDLALVVARGRQPPPSSRRCVAPAGTSWTTSRSSTCMRAPRSAGQEEPRVAAELPAAGSHAQRRRGQRGPCPDVSRASVGTWERSCAPADVSGPQRRLGTAQTVIALRCNVLYSHALVRATRRCAE